MGWGIRDLGFTDFGLRVQDLWVRGLEIWGLGIRV